MEKILQLGNLRKSTLTFNNPQCGRVYSIKGISPTINTCQGGEREPKILVKIKYDQTEVLKGKIND